jgi:hypothetical protein
MLVFLAAAAAADLLLHLFVQRGQLALSHLRLVELLSPLLRKIYELEAHHLPLLPVLFQKGFQLYL